MYNYFVFFFDFVLLLVLFAFASIISSGFCLSNQTKWGVQSAGRGTKNLH